MRRADLKPGAAADNARLIHKSGIETRGATHALVAHGALYRHEAVVKGADDGEVGLLGRGEEFEGGGDGEEDGDWNRNTW